MKLSHRKVPEKRLRNALWEHRDFLLEKLRNEWESLDKEESIRLRKQKLIKGARAAGMAAATTILALAAIAGVVVIAAVAPNVFAAFGKLGQRRYISRKGFAKTASYLKQRKFIEIDRQRDKYSIRITSKGLEKAVATSFERLTIGKPKSWDNKWRLVAFDIPEKHKWSREGFRNKLKEMGFYQFQKSIFAFPYPCFSEINFLSSLFNISDFVHCVETSALTNDGELRDFFDIS